MPLQAIAAQNAITTQKRVTETFLRIKKRKLKKRMTASITARIFKKISFWSITILISAQDIMQASLA
jgi:hypothetical protein